MFHMTPHTENDKNIIFPKSSPLSVNLTVCHGYCNHYQQIKRHTGYHHADFQRSHVNSVQVSVNIKVFIEAVIMHINYLSLI